MNLPISVENKIKKYVEKHKLSKDQEKSLYKAGEELYLNAKVVPYDTVGLLAAHSMAEPATQMILRTKHFSGAAEVSVGSGIEILSSLVDARSKVRSPSMHVFLKEDFAKDDAKAKNCLANLVYAILDDVAVISEDLETKKITVTFDNKLVAEKSVDKKEILEVLKKQYKKKITEEKNGVSISFDDVNLQTVRKNFLKLKKMKVIGLEGITDAILLKDDTGYYITTEGSNFKDVFDLDFVDTNKTYTNDVMETARVLGIEAARQLLVNELIKVYKDNGINIDARHLILLSDVMCFEGTIKGTVRSGIVSTKESPLARASFEQTEKVLFDAGFAEENEKFTGIIENILAGLPINVGIGRIELIMDDLGIEKKKSKGGK